MTGNETSLSTLAERMLGVVPLSIQVLRAHASARKIYRLHLGGGRSAIGIVNDKIEENIAFVAFSRSFVALGLRVPCILASDDGNLYIETDLGDRTLMDVLTAERLGGAVGDRVERLYRQALNDLLVFQTQGLGAIDTGLCYQGSRFDPAAVKRDLAYFALEYLGRTGVPNEGLDEDFEELAKRSDDYERGYFMFRDFQSRNIMILNENPWYIDYQSGREGPLQYDVASLLFQSQANLPYSLREELFDYYVELLSSRTGLDKKRFKDHYLVFVLIRALQNLGAYGKLGLGQGKEYFKNSIPYALQNCGYLLKHWPNGLDCNELRKRLEVAIKNGRH